MNNPGGSYKNWLLLLSIGAVLSLAAALFGFGLSYKNFLTPRSAMGQFKLIAGDGWVENGAQLMFRRLAGRGNRLLLTFNSWRPGRQPPAHMRAYVCGKVVSEFFVSPQNPSQVIYLRGSCEPRVVSLEVLNPVLLSESDRRQAGAQLLSARIFSRLLVPLLDPGLVLGGAGAMLLVAMMLLLALQRSHYWRGRSGVFLVLVPVCGFLLLTGADNFEYQKIYALWVLMAALSLGLFIGSRISPRALFPERGAFALRQNADLSWLGGFLLLVVVAGGGALRLYGLDFGLPDNYHPDEVPKINAVMRMVASGTLNPEYFLHPSLLIYLTYFVNTLFHWFGMTGEFRDTAFLAGRAVSASAGTLSIYLVYLVGRRLFAPLSGLVAAALMAFLPLHVTCSRYIKEDALLTCMLLACIAALLKAVQENRKGYLLFAGFLAGVAASSKYSGFLTLAIVAMAPWLRSKSWVPDLSWFKVTFYALLCAPVGFVMCTPYSLITYGRFIKGLASEKHHMLRGHTIPVDAWSQYWMYHFWRSILPGMTFFTALAGVAGAGLLLWRRKVEDLFVLLLLLLFYLPAEWVKAKPEPQPERYILPCLPVLAMMVGELVRVLKISRLRAVVPMLVLFAVCLPANRVLQLASEIKYDTRAQMADWMVANLPHGSKVYLDWKRYAPSFRRGEFQVTYIPRADILEKLNVAALKNSGFDYLVLSSLFYERYFTQPRAEPALRQIIRDVFNRVPIVKVVEPRYGTYGFHNPKLTLFSLKPEDFARLEEERRRKKEVGAAIQH